MRSTTVLLLTALTLAGLCGCTGWYSRYFERTSDNLVCTGQYCFSPRIVSYKDKFGEPDLFSENSFWISIKVYDTSIVQPEGIRDQAQVSRRKGLADIFQDRMVRLFRFDSLVLRLSPQDTSLVVAPDTARYSPRDIDYVSYNFGKVVIPEATSDLMAVFHYQILDETLQLPTPDSVMFDMRRFEEQQAITAMQMLEGLGGSKDKEKQETDD